MDNTMKHLLITAAAVAAIAAFQPAAADVIDAKFSGLVATQVNTSFAVGAAITGEFVYDTAASRYLSFTVGGQSVAPGYLSTATITPDLFSAIYQAQLSPVPLPGTRNSTFAVDLEGQGPWTSNNALALLSNAGQLATNLDTALSNFGYYSANGDGTDVHSLSATLSAFQVSAVPEPGTTALMLIGLAATARRIGRRKA
jgi:hypothetical protein